MAPVHATSLSPAACFLVERKPGKGYQVTSAEGAFANKWKGRALELLDALGQPDPKGPAEYFRWVGPIMPSGEYVAVSVKLMPNGEARYHQAWFQVPKAVLRPKRSIGVLIFVLLVGLFAGAFVGRMLSPSRLISGPAGSPGSSRVDGPVKDASPDPLSERLKNALASSRDERAKLKEYLSQEKLVVDTSAPVVDEKRSVKLIADLDTTPPPQESICLSNIEVAKLVKLLETLDEWMTKPKPSPKSRAR